MLEIPERIGPYRVLSVVGEGGMGVVYKAEDQRLERVVALKVIREFEGDSSRRRRFWQEARAATPRVWERLRGSATIPVSLPGSSNR
jgi:serine/threonine protein kinase